MEDTGALNSNTIINDNIRASREAIVEVLEESHADILSEINAAIAKLPEGDTASINDSYTYNISVNGAMTMLMLSDIWLLHISMLEIREILVLSMVPRKALLIKLWK